MRQLGSALGVAVLGTLLVTSLGRGTDQRLDEAGMPEAVRLGVVALVRGSAGAGIPALQESDALRRTGQSETGANAARAAMVEASRRTTGFAAAALALGLLATFAIPRPRGRHEPRPDLPPRDVLLIRTPGSGGHEARRTSRSTDGRS